MEREILFDENLAKKLLQSRDNTKRSIGKIILQKRTRLRMSQQILGEYLGKSKDAISKYERGITNIPAQEIPIFAQLLNMEINEFFAADSRESKNKESDDHKVVMDYLQGLSPIKFQEIFIESLKKLSLTASAKYKDKKS